MGLLMGLLPCPCGGQTRISLVLAQFEPPTGTGKGRGSRGTSACPGSESPSPTGPVPPSCRVAAARNSLCQANGQLSLSPYYDPARLDATGRRREQSRP